MKKIKFGRGSNTLSDEKRIMEFIGDVKEFLNEIVNTDDNAQRMFYPILVRPMRDAWPNVSPRFDILKNSLKLTSNNKLRDHGLTGNELEFKFSVIRYLSKKFFDNFPNSFSIAKIWLKKLLEALDKLLKSIFDAVGGGGAIGEYKDFIESCIDID